jgi:hypothetical protein
MSGPRRHPVAFRERFEAHPSVNALPVDAQMPRDLTDLQAGGFHLPDRLEQHELLLAELSRGFCLLVQHAGLDSNLPARFPYFFLSRRDQQSRCARRWQAKMLPLNRQFSFYRLRQVLHQVEAVRYLYRRGRSPTDSLSVDALAVAAHNPSLQDVWPASR